MNRIVIDFDNAEDLLSFTRLVAKAKTEEGTPGALWCALACSALKRAKTTLKPGKWQKPAEKATA